MSTSPRAARCIGLCCGLRFGSGCRGCGGAGRARAVRDRGRAGCGVARVLAPAGGDRGARSRVDRGGGVDAFARAPARDRARDAQGEGVRGRWGALAAEAMARAAEHGLGRERASSGSRVWPRAAEVSEADTRGRPLSACPARGTDRESQHVRSPARARGDRWRVPQGAALAQLQRATSSYLEHRTVVALGRVDEERRFTTRDLLACERAIVEGAARRPSQRSCWSILAPASGLAELGEALSSEQAMGRGSRQTATAYRSSRPSRGPERPGSSERRPDL